MQRRSTRSMKISSPVEEVEATKPVRRSRATRKSIFNNSDSESSDSDQDFVKKKTPNKQKRKITSSSSESDIENYLKPADEIDLNSSFFKSNKYKDDIPSFDIIEKEIFSGVKPTKLSDSDSSDDEEKEPLPVIPQIRVNNEPIDNENIAAINDGAEIARLNFQKLQDFSKQIEEAKKSVEQYNAKNLQTNVIKHEESQEKINIEDLLAIGEAKKSRDDSGKECSTASSVGNTSKEVDSDSEQEDWEEINESGTNEEESLIPKKELEITVELPSNMKKKKGNDLLTALKRHLNRRRKENQLLIHKVHLLCWIAHGNYLNSVLNDQCMLSLGLSLIPSEKSFPSKRIDLDYLEQILKWFKKTITLAERSIPENSSLEELLIEQIDKKEAYTKSMMVMIFIVILRSLGIQCRLVLSLQVEPLRPPMSDLHFLGNPSDSKDSGKKSIKIEKKPEKLETKTEKKNFIHIKSTEIKDEISDVKKRESLVDKGSTVKNEQSDKKRSHSSSKNEEKSKYFSDTDKKESGKTSGRYHKNQNQDKEKNDEKLKTRDKIKKLDEKIDPKKQHESRTKRSTKLNDIDTKEPIFIKKDFNKDTSKISNKTSNETNKESKNTRDKSWGSSKNTKDESLQSKRVTRSSSKSPSVDTSESNKKDEKTAPQSTKRQSSGSKNVKDKNVDSKRVTRSSSKSPSVETHTRSKSAGGLKVKLHRIDEEHSKLRSKSSSSTVEKRKFKKIPQLDGLDDSEEFKGFEKSPEKSKKNLSNFENFYTKNYSKVSKEKSSKVNLKNLKNTSTSNDEDCGSRKHRKSVTRKSYVEKDNTFSDDDFEVTPRKRMRSEKGVVKSANEDSDKKDKVNLQKLRRSKSAVENVDKNSPKKALDVRQDIMNLIKGRIKEQKYIDKSKLVKKRKPVHNSDTEDSDYVPEPIKKKYHDSDDEFYPKLKAKKKAQIKDEVKKVKKIRKTKDNNSRKVISSDSEYTEEEVIVKKEEPVKKKRGCDTWLEVFLEMEEKWMSVDVVRGQAYCDNELYSRASHPVSYVLAWNNNNHIKDITRRYCQNFNTVTRKLRIDSKWWEASLKPFLGPKDAKDREEDEELDRQQQEKPLPTTISEYKNHPLYALERHLLKFEAIYPPNAAPLGFVRNEPVYSRDCVFVCHSRDIWLKQAKVVKRKEKPYKIVKARPKYDKLSNTLISDQLLEIFGPWQVEDYDPPTAENGIVPRNAFGNVDLFQPSMIPKKCVHLRLAGLNKTAKKLNIDCAAAIVGFDFHGGWSHPVYDGFIVCEEYEDELVAAWNIEKEELEKKEQEKYEKRVYGNWKKLIKGLMIRERLKAKYGFGKTKEGESDGLSEPKEKKAKVIEKKKTRKLLSSSEEDD